MFLKKELLICAKSKKFYNKTTKISVNFVDASQLIRSSGSVGANYIEANEALSRKDFVIRIKICKKEAKESRYWLLLLTLTNNAELEKERNYLINEITQLMKIFGSILEKSK